ncbi:hypothetical protein [Pantoea sp. AS142]|uniref:hypothetical protein n=1 Tax=Pantoea sp. AS142 TaxID=3081292 RepID=UPI003018267A
MKTHFSENSQWGILKYLYQIYPRFITDNEISQQFGSLANAGLIANIQQLISEGSIEHTAITIVRGRKVLNPAALRLTKEGVKLMKNSVVE